MNLPGNKSEGPDPRTNPRSAELVGAIAEFMEAARAMRGMYDAYIEAGFDAKQALYLVGQLVRGQGGGDA